MDKGRALLSDRLRQLLLYYRTIRFLSLRQIFYRLYYHFFSYQIKSRWLKKRIVVPKSERLKLESTLQPCVSLNTDLTSLTFEFLNQRISFKGSIEWNYLALGKLWCYNLNYFDFLWVPVSNTSIIIKIIGDFIGNLNPNCIGLDPYCISLRTINWIKFLSKYNIKEQAVDEALYRQIFILNDTKEYHIMGNHLLENGFSLLFGAYYFNSKDFHHSACRILERNLPRQILKDGGHYELSPMYHQIMLGRILDACLLIQRNQILFDREILRLLKKSASKMLGWINKITFKNGTIPFLNDSAPNIGFETKDLNKLAETLIINKTEAPLGDSGYRKFEFNTHNGATVEVIIDIGSIKANEQPGHTHSDIFTFIILLDETPFIVDTGISTYNLCSSRSYERSTQAHNTVSLNGVEPIEIWKGFRVGRRPSITVLEDSLEKVSAYHDGYKIAGVFHQRTWTFSRSCIKIEDDIIGISKSNFNFNLHFHPSVTINKRGENVLETDQAAIRFSRNDFQIKNYNHAAAFNRTKSASKVVSFFKKSHQIEILFDHSIRP